jgi:hypothetical protein
MGSMPNSFSWPMTVWRITENPAEIQATLAVVIYSLSWHHLQPYKPKTFPLQLISIALPSSPPFQHLPLMRFRLSTTLPCPFSNLLLSSSAQGHTSNTCFDGLFFAQSANSFPK